MALEEAPPFWWERPGWQSWLLSPLSWVYGRAAMKRMAAHSTSAPPVPVICVGNFVVGGAGKTPTVELISRYLRKQRMKPGILTRGHGGAITSPTVVKAEKHNSQDVGDEALLHAAHATTVVSADRARGADLLIENGCNIIIMDDGFQNPSLEKDYCLVVVDAKRGIGNGFAIPAGPVRVPLRHQLLRADAVLVIGEGDSGDAVVRKCARAGKPVFRARASLRNPSRLKGKKVVAFAGIADPTKFYDSLAALNVEIADRQSFGDHHFYSEDECIELLRLAQSNQASLVTTTKDAARLQGMGEAPERLLEECLVIAMQLEPEDPAMLARITQATEKRFARRKLSKPSRG